MARLSTAGFCTELRNLLARCAERGVDPTELRAGWRRSKRAEWIAAANSRGQYEQVMLLRAAVGTASAAGDDAHWARRARGCGLWRLSRRS